MSILDEIAAERAAQDAKWGEQNHPDGTTGSASAAARAQLARDVCQYAARNNIVTWRLILNEEFYEAMAETDPAGLRAELLQVAAVAVAWVEAIDRRVTS